MTVKLREEYRFEGFPKPPSHYCDAVRYGDLVFISGLCGVDGEGRLAGEDSESQARQALVLLGKALENLGASPADVLKVNVYLTDMADLAAVNKPRVEFFGDSYPASTLVQVAGLVHPALKVEIEAVVGLPKQS